MNNLRHDTPKPPESPGWTELHRHLDVSLRLSTLLELAQRRGLEGQSTTLKAFKRRIQLVEPMESLAQVLSKFTLFQEVLSRPEDLERVAREAAHDCYQEGCRRVELRFSPSFICEDGSLSWEEALDAFDRGLQEALGELPGLEAGLLLIASRDYGPESAARTAELYLKNLHRVVGLDLAGSESDFPARRFAEAFRPVLLEKRRAPELVHITIHAGEAAGPQSVWEALELLGAERIGHGIRAFEDPLLVEHLRKEDICLEMCPTSNWITRAVDSFGEHPLKLALETGVPACINTDDPAIFGVTLGDEVRISREHIGLSPAQVRQSFEHAARASFLGGTDPTG